MSQSTVLMGAMLAAFVIYLAVNSRFGVYYNVLIGPSASAAPTTGSAPGNALGIDPNSALGKALSGIW
jgi:hypothetical protein